MEDRTQEKPQENASKGIFDVYTGAIGSRYNDPEMSALFSPRAKVTRWRDLWIALAKAERDMRMGVTDEQVQELEATRDTIDFDRIDELEKELHHDVMANIKAWGEICPTAGGIIHLGATSSYVVDNADVIAIREAMDIVKRRLTKLISRLETKSDDLIYVTTLAYTHGQAAQPITIGRRIATWAQDFNLDLEQMKYQMSHQRSIGCRGAVGTSDSVLKLLRGNKTAVGTFERKLLEYAGLPKPFTVCGQTYTRKQDAYIVNVLSGIAQSASKMATDIRLLATLGEVREPYGKKQVGSSAMPFKHNPMLCERVCGLARYVIIEATNTGMTSATQWLERSLDDSSNRRVTIPPLFIATCDILNTCITIIDGMSINYGVIREHADNHAMYISMEPILMSAVKAGGNRQELHEELRKISNSCTSIDDFRSLILKNKMFDVDAKELDFILNNASVGMSVEQVKTALEELRDARQAARV